MLILLHGLGATREVWRPMLAANRWHGTLDRARPARPWRLAPHGQLQPRRPRRRCRSTHRRNERDNPRPFHGRRHRTRARVGPLRFRARARVRPRHQGRLERRRTCRHEEDGVVGSTRASLPRRKTRWPVTGGKVAGLAAPDESGIAHTAEGWRLAYDPATATVGPPPMGALMAQLRCPVRLARGERDHMVTLDQLRAYDPQARDLPGGHNAMVGDPGAVWDWILG